MSLAGVCLSLAAGVVASAAPAGTGPASGVFIPVQRFTLAWVHSIEKVRWEEDYAVVEGDGPAAPPELRALAARVRGSAAGMEPPAGARLRNGWFEYTPAMHTTALRLTRSTFTPDYQWCTEGGCRPLSDWLLSDGGVTELKACRQTASR